MKDVIEDIIDETPEILSNKMFVITIATLVTYMMSVIIFIL